MNAPSNLYNIGGTNLEPPTRSISDRIFDLVLWGGIALLLIISFVPVEMFKIPRLFSNSENMQIFVSRFIKPNFSELSTYIMAMWLTIQIALWGTFLAIVFAVPLGFMTASNVAPQWLVIPMRRFMDFLRSVDGLVMGTIFLVAVGLGPLAGVLAIAFNTAGVLGKLFSEAVEATDSRPVEGVRATGAQKLHEIKWGVLPQVAPLWTSFALYRFESNARSATVLGLIGAGGIGQSLFESINAFKHEETSAIVIVIIVAVSLIDLLSQAMRSRLL
ncbi:MAG: phosphonate ABC transporter, permease protein PhnE [Caulobacterales bacterium]|nr:phosphonate ABC transporter, permease protein PhnE [Caulobacterales bacterium]